MKICIASAFGGTHGELNSVSVEWILGRIFFKFDILKFSTMLLFLFFKAKFLLIFWVCKILILPKFRLNFAQIYSILISNGIG